MVNTTTGQRLASPTASRPELPGRTRSRAAAASSLQLQVKRPFRSTTAQDQTSSRRICALPRHLVSGNQLEQQPRDRGRAVVRVVPVARAGAEVVPAAVVDVVAVAEGGVVLGAAGARANATILASAVGY